MNKIININLAGRLIPIDELAYDTLRDYLNRLKSFFSREDGGDEILRDMEDRIGELFQDKLKKGAACIMSEDVAAMMAVMGSPEQIELETADEDHGTTSKQQATDNHSAQKRLTRSKRDSLVGGVCGGMAQYFRIDPVIVRLAFVLISLAWGTGILVYLLLWALLPVSDTATQPLKRRLYRNPDQKVVGGVCSGIAAYANVDPIIPRIIFALPLLGMVFFGIFDEDVFFFPMFTGGLPTLVLLYIILWATLPKATTVAEKLEMRGEKVDVQNLSMAMKGEQDGKTETPKNSSLRKFLGLLIKIFVFFILGIMLIALAGAFIGIITALMGITSVSMLAFPLRELITDNALHQQLLWISLMLVILLPFFALIRLMVNLISGRRRSLPKGVTISLSVLFIAAIFCLFGVAGTIANDFKSRYSTTDNFALTQPSNDTLIVKQSIIEDGKLVHVSVFDDDFDMEGIRFLNDSVIAISNINLYFTESPDSLYHLVVHRSSYGRNSARARTLASPLPFQYYQEGNVLYLPYDFVLPAGQPFRGQKIKVEIQVPKNKVYKAEELRSSMRRDFHYRVKSGNFIYEERSHNRNWRNDVYFKMGTPPADEVFKDDHKDVYEDE